MAGVAPLDRIVAWLETALRPGEIKDFPGAHNGLQLANDGTVARIGAAVDACESVFELAAERGIQLLIVHHGLFWQGVQPVVGPVRRKFKLALDANLAVYSSHLPLDLHPGMGNNALLAKAIGLKNLHPFLEHGFRSTTRAIPLATLIDRLENAVNGPVHLAPGGPDRVRSIGLLTGGGGNLIIEAAATGVDTFITGEGPHWTYTAAEELGINLLYGGHYATETFGVKALAAEASKQFHIPWEFLDHPTGL